MIDHSIVLRHLTATYGKRSSVWIGVLLTTCANLIISGAIALVIAQLVVAIIQQAASAPMYLAVLFVLLLAASSLAGIADYVFVRGTDARYKDLVVQFYRELMRKDVSFFRGEKIGALNALFRDYMDGTINVFRKLRTDIIPTICAIFLPIAVLMYWDMRLAAIVSVSVAAQIAISILSARRVRPLRRDALKVYRELSGVMTDHIMHLAIMRAAARELEHSETVKELAGREAVLFWRRHEMVIRFDLLKGLVTAVCLACVFGVLVVSYQGGSAFTRLAVLCAIYVAQSMSSAHRSAEVIQGISEYWSRVVSALGVLAKETLEMAWVQDTSVSKVVVQDGKVVFDRVSFSYRGGNAGSEKVVFRELDLEIPDGHHLALVGQSGAGKSTIAHLLLRFDDVTSGAIRLGGLDLRDMSQRQLYGSVAYVPQEPDLLNTSVLENLRLFAPNAGEDDLWEVCRVACADVFIRGLDGGLNFQVGELGKNLSGGERQRVALARALLRNARLYVFDELTSALDPKTAIQVILNMRARLQGRTVVLMAHSHEVAELMDRALVVEDLQVHRRGFQGTQSMF